MKILVTGAGGFIGRNFVGAVRREHEVHALVRRTGAVSGVREIVGDLEDAGMYGSLPSTMDAIVHLAQANVPFPDEACELFSVNAGSTVRLLDYAVRAGVRKFVYASSGDVYGRRDDHCGEEDLIAPGSFYAVTKYASELAVRAYAGRLSFCILRFFRPYGPGQRGRAIPGVLANVYRGLPVRLNAGDRPFSTPVYIADITETLRRALVVTFCGTLNVAGDEVVSLKGIAEVAGIIWGKQVHFTGTGESVGNCLGRNDLMKTALGAWDMTSVQRGIEACAGEMESLYEK